MLITPLAFVRQLCKAQEKKQNFYLKNIVELVLQKHQLKLEGLKKILELRAPLNKGFSPELEKAFPNIIAVARPFVQVPVNIDKNWFVGFIVAGRGLLQGSVRNPPQQQTLATTSNY